MTSRPRTPRHSTDAPATSGRLRPLPDCIRSGVRVLLVGINPGIRSAEIGHHFAGYSNRFWKLLHESGLVPKPIGPEQDRRLPEWRYGITNLVARATPGIGDLRPDEYRAGRGRLVAKIRRFRPAVVALVGVTLYRVLFPQRSRRPRASARGPAGSARGPAASARGPAGSARGPAGDPVFGLRPEKLAGADVFVLPNPSGRNANFTYAEMLEAFRALKSHVGRTTRSR